MREMAEAMVGLADDKPSLDLLTAAQRLAGYALANMEGQLLRKTMDLCMAAAEVMHELMLLPPDDGGSE